MKSVKLSEITDIISGVGHFPDSPSGKPTKFLRITDLQNNLINANNLKSVKVVSKSHKNLDERKKIKKNDVIISIQGTVGKTAIANRNLDCYVSSSMIILRPKGIKPQYLLCAINSKRFQQRLEKLATGVTIQRVALPAFRSLMEILIPSESEQLKIIEKFKNLNKRIDDLKSQTLKAKLELENFEIK
jgi:type I restriction enzyme, S subunit